MSDQISLPLSQPTTWARSKGKHACGRDPEAGAGTCWYWWEGCPNAERRGCYLLWAKNETSSAAGKAGA